MFASNHQKARLRLGELDLCEQNLFIMVEAESLKASSQCDQIVYDD